MTETASATTDLGVAATTGSGAASAASAGAPGRAALLRAMEELAREQGVNNVGLREVARRAGLSHAAPTHFFGSREGMIRALAFEGLALLDDELCTAQERAAHLPGRERLVADALEFVAFAQRHPAHFDAMFRTPSSAAGDDTLDRARLAALDGLRALVVEVHAAGDIGGERRDRVPPALRDEPRNRLPRGRRPAARVRRAHRDARSGRRMSRSASSAPRWSSCRDRGHRETEARPPPLHRIAPGRRTTPSGRMAE